MTFLGLVNNLLQFPVDNSLDSGEIRIGLSPFLLETRTGPDLIVIETNSMGSRRESIDETNIDSESSLSMKKRNRE